MSKFLSKITHHTKNQEDLKLNEKRQSIDANIEMIDMLELSGKCESNCDKKTSTSNYEHA